MKKELSEEIEEQHESIEIPPKEPELSQMDFLVQSMKDMEHRLAEANKPKKRVASQKQIDNLKNARAKRAVMAEKKKLIKAELKESQKMSEKKYVNEKLKEQENIIDEPIAATNVDIPPPAEPAGLPKLDSFDHHPSNPNMPIRSPNPNDDNYVKPQGSLSQLKFAKPRHGRR